MIPRLVFTAGLPAFALTTRVAGAIGRGLLADGSRHSIRKLVARDDTVAIAITLRETGLRPVPLVARQAAIAV